MALFSAHTTLIKGNIDNVVRYKIMNWFEKIAEPVLEQQEISKPLQNKIDEIIQQLPAGYNVVKTTTGWQITGPDKQYIIERDDKGWSMRPAGQETPLIRKEHRDKNKIPELYVWRLAVPHIKFRDATARLTNILKTLK